MVKASRLRAGEKTFLLVATAVGIVSILVIGISVYFLTRNHTEGLPRLSATVGTDRVTVAPTSFCEIDATQCREGAPGTFARKLAVAPDHTIVVSLPTEIANAPWSLTMEYLIPDQGFERSTQGFISPGKRFAFTASSSAKKILSTIEIRLPSSRVDEAGNPVTRAYWSIDTLPTGTPIPRN